MKKHIWYFSLVFALLLGLTNVTQAADKNKRPDRPEKIVEVLPERPSQYHFWVEGKWKWRKKQDEWEWRSGYWKLDQDYLYNANRLNRFNRFNRFNSFYSGRFYRALVRYGNTYRVVRVYY